MKGKVLSVRVSTINIASARELCTLTGIHTANMSTAVGKALALLLENLRANGTLAAHTPESASAYLRETLGQAALVGSDFDLTVTPSRASPGERTRVPQGELPAGTPKNLAQQYFQELPKGLQLSPVPEYGTEQILIDSAVTSEDYAKSVDALSDYQTFDESIVADIRLQQELESEELLSALLVTSHRRDDHEVELIDPASMIKETKKEGGE